MRAQATLSSESIEKFVSCLIGVGIKQAEHPLMRLGIGETYDVTAMNLAEANCQPPRVLLGLLEDLHYSPMNSTVEPGSPVARATVEAGVFNSL